MSPLSSITQQMREPLEISPFEAARQNKAGYLASGKDAARAIRDSLTGENSLEVSAGKDSVIISEEGRAMQQRMAPDGKTGREKDSAAENAPADTKSLDAGGLAGTDGDEAESTAERTIQDIKKQIAQVKEKLEQAKQRLAEATAVSGGTDGSRPAESSGQEDPSGQAAATAQAMAQTMGNAMGRSAEAEAIQAEIDMLNQQLQMLNQQLLELIKGQGGGAAMGSAGIGGAGDRGGLGERISVSA